MICTRCQLYFLWSEAKRLGERYKKTDHEHCLTSDHAVDYVIALITLGVSVLSILVYFKLI